MSTSKRRRGKSLHLELPNEISEGRPPVAAVFLVQFDVKAGYTIAWKQSITGLELSESVEFKSLPSGLHNLEEDLVYFVHGEDHAGISAFINRPAAESQRNALMLAVGALVPLSHGRLGKSWKYAEELKALAQELIEDPLKTNLLEEFWQNNGMHKGNGISSPESAAAHREDEGMKSQRSPHNGPRKRNRAISSASALAPPGQRLSPHHPALSLPSLLDTFGPLVYPLYKAALLRKRILLVTQVPVELPCNFVYDLSVLSNIPGSISDLLPLEPLPTRIQPLFSVGVHDIDTLSHGGRREGNNANGSNDDGVGYGWIACTTDDVLATKQSLFDVLVVVPPTYSRRAKEKIWPRISNSKGTENRASQRDFRRYRTLRRGLRRQHPSSRGISPSIPKNHEEDDEDDRTTLLPVENTQETFDDASSTSDEKLIEPLSWSALAYSSFMWWASAGEKGADLDEEVERDAALLPDLDGDLGSSPGRPKSRRRSTPDAGMMSDGAAVVPEMAIIAHFHRLTAQIVETIAEVVEAGYKDDGADGGPRSRNGEEAEKVLIGSEDIAKMGLDVWSEGDRKFVVELVEFYWGRKAEVEGGRVECCGVRIS